MQLVLPQWGNLAVGSWKLGGAGGGGGNYDVLMLPKYHAKMEGIFGFFH